MDHKIGPGKIRAYGKKPIKKIEYDGSRPGSAGRNNKVVIIQAKENLNEKGQSKR